jgi:hypothetical protein
MKAVPFYALAATCLFSTAFAEPPTVNSATNTTHSSTTTVQTKDCSSLTGTERSDCVARANATATRKSTSTTTTTTNATKDNGNRSDADDNARMPSSSSQTTSEHHDSEHHDSTSTTTPAQ